MNIENLNIKTTAGLADLFHEFYESDFFLDLLENGELIEDVIGKPIPLHKFQNRFEKFISIEHGGH